MKQRKKTYLLFAICVAAVFGVMTWLTGQLLNFEEKEAQARRAEIVGTQRRTALWRLDSFLAPFLTQEAARPYFHYYPFYEPDQAYTKLLTVACKGEISVPSPLLAAAPPFCKLHFQINQGHLTSPQVPMEASQRGEAQRLYATAADNISSSDSLLNKLELIVPINQLTSLASLAIADRNAWASKLAIGFVSPADSSDPPAYANYRTVQKQQSQNEYNLRSRAAQNALNSGQTAQMMQSTDDLGSDVEHGPLAPVWLTSEGREPELFLLREVRVGTDHMVQGVWVDWPKLKTALVAEVTDLLPSADLKPVTSPVPHPESTVAGVRAQLVTSEPREATLTWLSPTRKSLVIAWTAVLISLLAIGLVLYASMELGERRGRFVSAVTHELRTPLTTFCLYSQMLADGMVRDEASKREYLTTLKREANRLAKIVENVLCFARLAEVRSTNRSEDVDAGELVERMLPTLSRRAAEAGMELEVTIDALHGASLHVDPQTVERILTNLTDNACKYAAGYAPPGGAPDHRIHLIGSVEAHQITLSVADHGPGIPHSQRARVFRAFNRSGSDSSNTKPGLGLGLSLSRGLARSLGGDLVLESAAPGTHGARLSLVIPARPSPRHQQNVQTA